MIYLTLGELEKLSFGQAVYCHDFSKVVYVSGRNQSDNALLIHFSVSKQAIECNTAFSYCLCSCYIVNSRGNEKRFSLFSNDEELIQVELGMRIE